MEKLTNFRMGEEDVILNYSRVENNLIVESYTVIPSSTIYVNNANGTGGSYEKYRWTYQAYELKVYFCKNTHKLLGSYAPNVFRDYRALKQKLKAYPVGSCGMGSGFNEIVLQSVADGIEHMYQNEVNTSLTFSQAKAILSVDGLKDIVYAEHRKYRNPYILFENKEDFDEAVNKLFREHNNAREVYVSEMDTSKAKKRRMLPKGAKELTDYVSGNMNYGCEPRHGVWISTTAKWKYNGSKGCNAGWVFYS